MVKYLIEVTNNGTIEETHVFENSDGSQYDVFESLKRNGFTDDVFTLYRVDGETKTVELTANYNDL